MARRTNRMAPEEPSLTYLLLQEILPEEYAAPIHNHIFHPHSPVQVFWRNAVLATQRAADIAYPLVRPAVDAASDYMAANPGLMSTAILLLAVVALLFVMRWVQRMVMFWVRLGTQVLFWAAAVVFIALVWQNGIYDTTRSLMVFGSKALGYLASVRDIWLREYHRYEAQQRR
jgi:Nuclear pore assembly and biogenesis